MPLAVAPLQPSSPPVKPNACLSSASPSIQPTSLYVNSAACAAVGASTAPAESRAIWSLLKCLHHCFIVTPPDRFLYTVHAHSAGRVGTAVGTESSYLPSSTWLRRMSRLATSRRARRQTAPYRPLRCDRREAFLARRQSFATFGRSCATLPFWPMKRALARCGLRQMFSLLVSSP